MRRSARPAALLALLSLAPAAAAGATEPALWRHGIIEAKSDAGFYLMVTKGFAEKQGLKLEISQFKADVPGLQALIAGQLDTMDGGSTAAMVAAARGANIKAIGCEWPGVPYGVFARAGIATPADLKGKIMAISAPGASPDVVARAVLAKYGIPADQVRFANLGSDLDRFKAVVAGVADATVVSNEYTPIAEKEGVKLLLRAATVVPNWARTCIFANGQSLAEHPEAAVRFLAAEISAFRHAVAHRDETLALTREITGAKPDDPRPAFIFDDAVATHAVNPDLSIPIEKLRWMAAQLVTDGVLTKPFDMTSMIDDSFREKALARAGE